MGRIFGERYEVLEQIGSGGMAIVYKAKDLLLNRIVTIKVLREQFVTDEDFIRRFRREAQSAASLSHPNIVSIYDVGKDGDTDYIVMEYVKGRNLKEIIREFAPLSNEQSINLALQITGAIQNAHAHNIIHRDIKPHNILVTTEGQVKVTDFGIARAVSSATVTHTGDIVGSVHYLSPEQAKGIQSNEQSDIYSLGIVLYELLTGKVPYDGETPIAIALKHLQQEPELPSKLNPRVNKELEGVIMHAIAKAPERRYQTAKDLLDDLSHLQAGKPIAVFDNDQARERELDPEKTQTHKGMGKVLAPVDINDSVVPVKSVDKKRRMIIIGGVVLLLVLIGGGIWKFFSADTTTVPDLLGKTVPVAEDYLKQARLTLDPEITYEYSGDYEKDRIIEQSPEANSSVREGREVRVKVSKGIELLEFPNVTIGQMSKDMALKLITDAGFDVEKIVFVEQTDDAAKGSVIGQNPAPKTPWPKDEKITLIISAGPQWEKINMPSVLNLVSAEAKAILEEHKLVPRIETEDSDMFPAEVVIRTIPAPGEAVQQGSEVTVVISRGPGPYAQGIDHKSKRPTSIAKILTESHKIKD